MAHSILSTINRQIQKVPLQILLLCQAFRLKGYFLVHFALHISCPFSNAPKYQTFCFASYLSLLSRDSFIFYLSPTHPGTSEYLRCLTISWTWPGQTLPPPPGSAPGGGPASREEVSLPVPGNVSIKRITVRSAYVIALLIPLSNFQQKICVRHDKS